MSLNEFSIFICGERAFGRQGIGEARGVASIFWSSCRETLGAATGEVKGRPLRRAWYNLILPGGVEDGSICKLHSVFGGSLAVGPLTRTAAGVIVDFRSAARRKSCVFWPALGGRSNVQS